MVQWFVATCFHNSFSSVRDIRCIRCWSFGPVAWLFLCDENANLKSDYARFLKYFTSLTVFVPCLYFQFANHLFILMVGLSYSALAPIITPFVALYFGFGYIVWMHQTLSIYIPNYSCGGMMWPRVFNRYRKWINLIVQADFSEKQQQTRENRGKADLHSNLNLTSVGFWNFMRRPQEDA